MTLVQREKEAWSGKGDVITKEGSDSIHRPPLTAERKKMVQVGGTDSVESTEGRERIIIQFDVGDHWAVGYKVHF